MSRRTSISLLLALIGIAAIWFGTQTLDQEHGPDPGGKVLVLGWLSSELWMNLWLLGLGMFLLIAAVFFFIVYPRLRRVDRVGVE